MNCIICKGKLENRVVEHKEFGISLGKFKVEACKKCGEVFFDSETAVKIQTKSKELGLFGLAKRTKVAEVGNSLAIRIPKEIANFMKLKKEAEVKIVPKSSTEITIRLL